MGWLVHVTLRPHYPRGKGLVLIVQEAAWYVEKRKSSNLHRGSSRALNRQAHYKYLYRLCTPLPRVTKFHTHCAAAVHPFMFLIDSHAYSSSHASLHFHDSVSINML